MMNRSSLIVLLLGAAVFAACSREQAAVEPQEEPTSQEVKESPIYIQGEANILLDDDLTAVIEETLQGGTFQATKSISFNELVEQLGITSLERVFPDAGEFEARHREFGLHKWYHIRYNQALTQTKAGEIALDYPGISCWEPIRKVKNEDIPFNDTYLSSQWHYYNNGRGSSRVTGADVNVYPVWENYTTGSSDVIVSVVDGGIDYVHEDLSGQVLVSQSKNFRTGSSVITPHSHGTHVAGTIAAINDNGKGVSGIAGGDAKKGNPGVRLISCQIFVSDQDGSGNGPDAIVWGADHGAVLSNNSWGIDYDGISDSGERAKEMKKDHEFFLMPNEYPYQHSIKSAVDYFNATAGMTGDVQTGPMAGGLVLFAAGNDTSEYGGYSAYPGVVAVGAIGPNGNRAYYSNFGDWVDICAPGGDSYQEEVLSTLPDNRYGYMQGTSMACPHLTGVAALVVSYCGGLGFTRQMLLDRLINSARTEVPSKGKQIGPLVDALGAITYGEDLTPTPVTAVTSDIVSNSNTLSWTVTGNGTIPAYGYLVFVGKNQQDVASSVPGNIKSGVEALTKETGSATMGSTLSLEMTGLDFETTYYCKIYGYDYSLHYSTASSVFSFTTKANQPPVLTPDVAVSGIVLHAFQDYTVNIEIADPDGHNFNVEHVAGSSTETFVYNNITGKYVFYVTGVNGTLGSHTAKIRATDEFGKTAELSISYSIVNEPPRVVKPLENVLFRQLGEQYSFDMSEYVVDPDGEVLTYTVTNSSPLVAHFNPNQGKLHGMALGAGLSEVTVTGTDALGESVTLSFKALVRTSGAEIVTYPNPVVDILYISNDESVSTDTKVILFSSSGAKIYEIATKASAFDPAVIDMSACAPGRYSASITVGEKSYKQTIVKK